MSTNLPLSLTSFIGRGRELAEIRARLASCRLLTLTGTGGVGKSRLALEVAAQLLEEYPEGVWWVELAALNDGGAVPRTVAAAFGMHEQPGQPLVEAMQRYLQGRKVLLVLDNCEHLLPACATLAESLLLACANLRLLATSREALNVAGERIWLTPSLAVEAEDGPSEAASLFTDRAFERNPGFRSAAEVDRARTASICRELDGIPLAIELAAARTNVLSLKQIAERLDERFELLTGGRRTSLPRHRTLRAMVDWSYELLSEAERVLFRRLAVFAGGWTLAAAESVCAGDDLEVSQVLELLSRLVARSLVVSISRDGGMRYTLLETLRQYAAEKLHESGEEIALSERHIAWFVSRGEEAARNWQGPNFVQLIREMDTESENLEVALRWAQGHPENLMDGLRLASALLGPWYANGHLVAGLEAVRGLGSAARRLQHKGDVRLQGGTWVGFMATAGTVAVFAGQLEEGQAVLDECLRLTDDPNEHPARLRALASRALLELFIANPEAARPFLVDGDRLVATSHDMLAVYMHNYALFEHARLRGEFDTAEAHMRKNLAIAQSRRDPWSVGMASAWLGSLAFDRREYTKARRHLEEAVRVAGGLGESFIMVFALESLAAVRSEERQPDRA